MPLAPYLTAASKLIYFFLFFLFFYSQEPQSSCIQGFKNNFQLQIGEAQMSKAFQVQHRAHQK